MQPDLSVGIDVGATKISLGVVDQAGAIVATAAIEPWQYPALEDNLAHLASTLEELLAPYDRGRFHDIGVGLPGTVDDARGLVVYTPNLRWIDLPLAGLLRDRTGLGVHLVQDTAAAAWGEFLFGAGRGLTNVVCATLGSGLACGVIINGQLYGGANHTAGEIGHLRIADPALICGCGANGCLEAGGSGLGLVKIVRRDIGRGAVTPLAALAPEALNAHAIFEAAHLGDPVALAAINEMIGYLAVGLSAIAVSLTPDALILSGGLSREHDLLLEPLIQQIRAVSYRTVTENVRIVPAALGPDAPLIGAAMLHRAPEYSGQSR
jgi:glucokinase